MLSGVNANTALYWSNISRQSNIKRQPSSFSASLLKNNNEILIEIKDKVSSALSVSVQLSTGSKSDCGNFTLTTYGFTGVGIDGSSPFFITQDILIEMATDESKYKEWMSWIDNKFILKEIP